MNTLRHILVPSDFSEPSRAALDYAAGLARPFDATIDVLYVWELPTFIPTAGLAEAGAADLSLLDRFRQNAEDALAQFVREAKARGVEVRATYTELGGPASTIVDFAKKRAYDLIVIGTHGRTGISRAVIGSVAERVVRHAACPVLAVRATPSH